jgi:hypothetical protein
LPGLRLRSGDRRRLVADKAHRSLLHFELRHIRDFARQSGKAVTLVPSLEWARDAAGEHGATAVQCGRDCPSTEHRSIGVADLCAVKLTPRATHRVSIRTAQRLNPKLGCYLRLAQGLIYRIWPELGIQPFHRQTERPRSLLGQEFYGSAVLTECSRAEGVGDAERGRSSRSGRLFLLGGTESTERYSDPLPSGTAAVCS